MKKPYFVILKHPNGEYLLPLTDDFDEMVQFETIKEACEGAKSSSLGSESGFSVFRNDEGVMAE